MKQGCPNSRCKFYKSTKELVKNGSFKRSSDSKLIQRYKCKSCDKSFSAATFSKYYRQKKRRINFQFIQDYCSGVSQRRCAKKLKVNPTTIERRVKSLSDLARKKHALFLESSKKIKTIQMDDLITLEHTKLKQLTVSVAVSKDTRVILGAKVKVIGTSGNNSELAKRKYGVRANQHEKGLFELLSEIKKTVAPKACFETDDHQKYPKVIKEVFPDSEHKTFESIRGCVTGQGELKKTGFDPLFCINHTLAMMRANINRLFRRTWNTTKKLERLQDHIDMFIYYHNTQLLPQK